MNGLSTNRVTPRSGLVFVFLVLLVTVGVVAVSVAGGAGQADVVTQENKTDSADFQIVEDDLPESAGQAHNVTIEPLIENVGNATGVQNITYDITVRDDDDPPDDPPDDIVVVDDERDTSQGAHITAILESEFGNNTVDLVNNTELLDVTGDYSVFVIQRFDSDGLADDFLDSLGDNQGAVYLDSHQGASEEQYSDGVYRMHNVRDDPAEWDSEGIGTDGKPAEVTLTADHPIFDGVGEEGDTVVLNEDDSSWGSWFDDYSGDVIADVDYSPSDDGAEGPGIGVNDEDNEVLLNALSYDFFSDVEDITPEGETVLVNAVEHVAAQANDSAAVTDTDDSLTTETGDGTVHEESIQDNETVLQANTTLELDGGEEDIAEIEFEIPGNLAPGTYNQTLETQNDSVTTEISIDETAADIEVSAYFLDPDPAEEDLFVGDTLTAEAVVANHGNRSGEFEVRYQVGEEVVDNETVAVDADAVKTVDLDHELRQDGTKIISVNGVDPVQITVDPIPATFDVEIDENASTLAANATENVTVVTGVENVGMETGTQDITATIDGDIRDSVEDVELDAGQSETANFTFAVDSGDDGEVVVVESQDRNDSAILTVDDEDGAFFDVGFVDVPPNVSHGKNLSATYEVENTGTETGTQTVTFSVNDTVANSTEATLEDSEQTTTTVTHDTLDNDAGEVELELASNDTSDFSTVDIEHSVLTYANESGVVETDGLLDAIDHWREDDVDTGLLLDVIDAWRDG